MLTGDKVETATSIAISSGLKARRNDLYFMREISTKDECNDKISVLARFIQKTTLIIDGKTLDTIITHEDLTKSFF
jgi:phospholipid-translocating ATPase